jgi:glycerophosphoryl diester phosphodiesterase
LYLNFVKFAIAVSGPLNAHLQKRGVFVFYWVLNYQDEWEYAIQKGANGIITDAPASLKEFLDNRL